MVKKPCNCGKAKSLSKSVSLAVSCESALSGTFTTVTGTVFTATMTATGSGTDCESAKINSELNMAITLANFLATYTPQIVEETTTVTTTCAGCQPDLELYYRIDVSPTDPERNDSYVDLATNPPDIEGAYNGISTNYMNESNFVTYNKNIITFIGNRTPANQDVPADIRVPDIYQETVCISIPEYENNFVQATANYLDSGNTDVTTVPFVDYGITTASGVFLGYKTIRIFFDNDNVLGPVRTVKFLK
jgi:hypothetical protein